MQTTYDNRKRKSVKFPVYEYITLFVPVMILIILVGFYIAYIRTESSIELLTDEDSIRLHHISGYIGAHMTNAFNHLQAIYNEKETRSAINTDDPEAISSLEKSFLILARRNQNYAQIRWIDEKGMEKVRVSRDNTGPYLTSREKLQDKSHRYYFKAANSLLAGEYYASKIDLNVEHGIIEKPARPTLRIATPVFDAEGNRRGIIIINILMMPVFNTFRNLELTSGEGKSILLNQQGMLLHGNLQISESTVNDSVNRFSSMHPVVWNKISTTNTGHLELSDGIWTWKRITSLDSLIGFKSYDAPYKSGSDSLITGDFSLIFVVQRPLSFLLEMRRNIRVSTFSGVAVVLLLYGMSLYFYLNGNFRARQAELEAIYARGQATSMTRLKEHEERFRRLVEFSSIGQLVIDDKGKIVISNPTIEQMLGYDRDELTGSPVEKLIPASRQQEHITLRKNYIRHPLPRKMGEGRELEALRKDGTTIPVEIGLNPYTEQNKTLVLVNIIDLSNRTIQA